MPKSKNALWRFLASVQLALVTLTALAVTSILGTLIQQGQTSAHYVREYGPGLARLVDMLDLANMYSSWWFVALLSLFALNLVVCSIDRLPGAWRLVTLDNLSVDPGRLERMERTHRAEAAVSADAAAERVHAALVREGWKRPRRRGQDGAILLFAQKGAWTRLGVYVVHLSILLILAGAAVGLFFGVQAFVFLPEGRSTKQVFLRGSNEPFSLGFELRCDRFERAFYPDGRIREYRADLTVSDPRREAPYRKSVIVNDPLTYRGITFYQADAQPLEEFSVSIRNRTADTQQAFRVPPDRLVRWPGTDVFFRIEELKRDPDGAVRQAGVRVFVGAEGDSPVFWVEDKGTVTIRRSGTVFSVSFRQLYSTLLLATRDPEAVLVYFGCGLMVVGLAVSFFFSQRRIWVRITPKGDQGSHLLVSGVSNKNQPAFARRFRRLAERIEDEVSASPARRAAGRGNATG